MNVAIRLYSILLLFSITAAAAADQTGRECPAVLDHQLRPLAAEQPVSLCERHAGKVLLVVNTASFCGYTDQYRGLEALYARYRERGLEVLGFPSNDFAQEPGSEAEIKEFCQLTYDVQFPMYEKLNVRGEDAHPMYRRLAELGGQAPGWNFHKYLIDRSGKQITSFATRVRPDDPALIAVIESLL